MVIIGAGGVGLSAIQIAKIQGSRVLAIEPREEARRAAGDHGADVAISSQEAAHSAREWSKDSGIDVAIDFVGTRATFDLGRSLLGYGGRFIAVAPGEETVAVTANDLVDRGKAYLRVFVDDGGPRAGPRPHGGGTTQARRNTPGSAPECGRGPGRPARGKDHRPRGPVPRSCSAVAGGLISPSVLSFAGT